jgi:hypothetical protein
VARRPYVYIRRSRVDTDNPGAVSQETQTSQATALVGVHEPGATPEVIADWGRSGRGSKTRLREGYARLVAAVEADEVSGVYSYNLSRLGRNVDEVRRLVKLAQEHGTEVRLVDIGTISAGATGTMLITILAAVDEWQAEVQAERTMAGIEAWQTLHPDERLGRTRYGAEEGESVEVVCRAFDIRRSYNGAAAFLNANGVLTRTGKTWEATTVARIVRRHQHESEGHPGYFEYPGGKSNGVADKSLWYKPACPKCFPKRRPGVRVHGTRVFTGLLVCRCGGPVTSMPRSRGATSWYCRQGGAKGLHARDGIAGPYIVSESKVLAWARAEVAKADAALVAHGALPDVAALRAQVARIDADTAANKAHFAQSGDWDAYSSRLAHLMVERETAEAALAIRGASATRPVPCIDWDAPAADVNAALRRLWRRVILNGGMLPHRAVWAPDPDGLWTEEGPDAG